MKKTLASASMSFLRLYGSLWIAFLVSMIPLYILRGQSFESVIQKELYEKILMSVIALLSTFAALTLLTRAADASERITKNEALASAGLAVGFHFFLGAILWLIGKNHFLIAVCGTYLCRWIQTGADDYAGPIGMLLGGFVAAIVYFADTSRRLSRPSQTSTIIKTRLFYQRKSTSFEVLFVSFSSLLL